MRPGRREVGDAQPDLEFRASGSGDGRHTVTSVGVRVDPDMVGTDVVVQVGEPDPGPTPIARDPVCGMDVDPRTAAGTSIHAGVTYYFCSDACRDRFETTDPQTYLVG